LGATAPVRVNNFFTFPSICKRNIFLPIDKEKTVWYNAFNQIGQFVTILSVNKTRTFRMGALRSFLFCGRRCVHFFVLEDL